MIHNVNIIDFLKLAEVIPVADVRTPAEYSHAHIVGAYNLPIFSDEERVQVGTTYKQKGREEAILLGFDLTGDKWSGFIKQALEIAPKKKILVHCWRGGMRSGAMAWALNLYGFEVYLLEGGYKKYRNFVLETLSHKYSLLILGGMTGSGKTGTLNELKRLGQQVIDLEAIAGHQGSAYGSMGRLIQPTQEHFENTLATELHKIERNRTLWLEDESRFIGKRQIPNALFDQIRQAKQINMTVPAAERIGFLLQEYGTLDKTFLIDSTKKIMKRLGPEQTRDAVQAIEDNRMADFIRILLTYYDKTYSTGQSKRDKQSIFTIDCDGVNPEKNAMKIVELLSKNTLLKKHDN